MMICVTASTATPFRVRGLMDASQRKRNHRQGTDFNLQQYLQGTAALVA